MANVESKDYGLKELGIAGAILAALVGGGIGIYWTGDNGAGADAGVTTTRTGASGTTPAAPLASPAAHPATPAVIAVPASTGSQIVHADIYFDFNRSRLRADAVSVLQEKVALLRTGGPWVVMLQGYADQQGPAQYNKGLAERRAQAVKQFLVELGVPETSIKVVIVGPDGSLCDEPTRECQQLNRRVHMEMRQLAAVPATPASSTPTSSETTRTSSETTPASSETK
jgi:outer membrane protein OmpA-like peptidoglycan-associated protein